LTFEEIPKIQSFAEITNLKKLKGYENAYRIRIGDYRIGIIFDGETVMFQRVLHRKDIYLYFHRLRRRKAANQETSHL
jgi:mRNA-degrading endonuclease RelE of RelBE toxin-antitoxin system